MSNIDPEQEQEGLAATYAAMSDSELENLARARVELTESALVVLQEEFRKRGLEWSPEPQGASAIAEAPLAGRPVVLRRYRDMPQAFIEKTVLEDAGIPCFLQDDNVIRMDWLWSNAMGGIKLLVREEDLEEADGVLQQAQMSPPEADAPQSQ